MLKSYEPGTADLQRCESVSKPRRDQDGKMANCRQRVGEEGLDGGWGACCRVGARSTMRATAVAGVLLSWSTAKATAVSGMKRLASSRRLAAPSPAAASGNGSRSGERREGMAQYRRKNGSRAGEENRFRLARCASGGGWAGKETGRKKTDAPWAPGEGAGRATPGSGMEYIILYPGYSIDLLYIY